jgi:hypothetical protein
MRGKWFAGVLQVGALGVIGALPAAATTYVAMPDAELATHAPIVVLADVVDQSAELWGFEGWTLPHTRTRFHPTEVLKGRLDDDLFELFLPGGTVGETSWVVPGMPRFEPGSRVLLFLAPAGRGYVLTELALSKFEVLVDESGRRFAVRPEIAAGTARVIARRGSAPPPERPRALEPFLDALRAAGRGEAFSPAPSAPPTGALHRENRSLAVGNWVNVGGREPGVDCLSETCLLRWFWDNGRSPEATVTAVGTQSNLTDGSDGRAHVSHAIDAWSGVSGTELHLQSTGAGGNVVVHLDADATPFGGWSSPMGCGGFGVLGIAVPVPTGVPADWRGDRYVPIGGAQVYLRRVDCAGAYDASWFRSVVVHEMGHVLGLGHSTGQEQSNHSLSESADLDAAVMRQYLSLPNPPDQPQADDGAGLRHLYPGDVVTPPPPATAPPLCGPGTGRICPPDQGTKIVSPRG